MSPSQARALRTAASELARRDLTAAELHARLEAAGSSPEDASWACEWLAGRGVLDDSRVAGREAEVGARRRGWGRARIEARLDLRGVAKEDAEQAVAWLDEPTEAALAQAALARRLGPKLTAAGAARFLAGRGFGEEAVRRALDESFPGWEDTAR